MYELYEEVCAMSEDWAKKQEKEYTEMYEQYYDPNWKKAKELADKVFDLIKDKDFGEDNIEQETQAKFDSFMQRIDGIEKYFYKELSKLLNENKTEEDLSALNAERENDKKDIARLIGNNLRFGYLLGNYMLDGKFNDELLRLIWAKGALNYVFYNIVRGSNFNFIKANKYQNRNFYECIWGYDHLKNTMEWQWQIDEINMILLNGYISGIGVGCKNMPFIYNLIREKGFDLDDFIRRYNLAKNYVEEHNKNFSGEKDRWPSIDFADDMVKKFADLDKMFCLASIYDANGTPEAKFVFDAIANVYASLQSLSLNYDEMIQVDLKKLVGDEIDKTSSNKADVKNFFESFIFGKDIEPKNLSVVPKDLATYNSTYEEFPSEVFNLLDIKEENLLNWLSNRVNEDNGEDGFEEQKSYFEEDMKRIEQLHGEIFDFIEKNNQKKSIQNAREKFLQSKSLIGKLNDYICLCERFGLADNLKAARSLRQWIIQNKLRGRVEDTFIAYAEKKFNEECEKSVDLRVNDRANKIKKLVRFKKIVFRECTGELCKIFNKMYSTYVNYLDPDELFYRIRLIDMLKNGNGIDGVLNHLEQNSEDTQAIVLCMISNPSLFFNNKFGWPTKAKIAWANAKNKYVACEEYERYTVRNLISDSDLTKEEIAVAFRLSEKTYWWNRNKNLQRLLTKVNDKSGFKIIAEVVSKLSPGQEDKFFDWLYKNRDELITENGVVKNLFEKAEDIFITNTHEDLIKLVPEEKQDRFREYFKDPDFRKVVQTEQAMQNMLLVDKNCYYRPVEYIRNCRDICDLDNIRIAFEKFSAAEVKEYHWDFFDLDKFGEMTLSVWQFQFLNDFILHADALKKYQKAPSGIDYIKDLANCQFDDDFINQVLDNCQFVTTYGNTNNREAVFLFLYQVATYSFLRPKYKVLFSKEFISRLKVVGVDKAVEQAEKALPDFKIEVAKDAVIDFPGLYYYAYNYKCDIVPDFLSPDTLAQVLFESTYGNELYNNIVDFLNHRCDAKRKREVEKRVIELKTKKIEDVFTKNGAEYGEFVSMIKNDEAHLIGRFISNDTDLNLLSDVKKAGMDLSKINGLDLSAMQKMFKQNPNDKDKMLKSFVSYAKGREQGDVANLIYYLPNAQELINGQINGQKIYPNKQWVRWAKYMADAVIFEIENNGAELGKYVKLLDRKDLPKELKNELESRPQVIAAKIANGTYNIDDISDLPSNTTKLARAVAQKLKSLPGKDAGDLAEIAKALYKTGKNLAMQIAANLNMIPEVAQQLNNKSAQEHVENSVRFASQELEI